MKPYFIVCLLLVAACDRSTKSTDTSDKSTKTSELSWIQLFNGKDLNDWNIKITGHDLNDNYANTFTVSDGAIKVKYDGYGAFNDTFGHIFHKDKFSYYILRVEHRFTGEQAKGGPGWAIRNSGAMLHSQDPATMGKDQDFPISIEVQLLGGDGKYERSTANLCTPGTNVVIKGELITDHCISSKSKTFHGEEWVTLEVLVLGDSLIRHKIGGEIVLAYEKPQVGGGNVSNYDPAVKRDGELLKEGFIALQSESHPVEFRKVEILDLASLQNDPEKLKTVLENNGF